MILKKLLLLHNIWDSLLEELTIEAIHSCNTWWEIVEISENNGNATDKLSCANDTLKKIEIKDNDKHVLDVNGLRRKDSRGFGKRVRMIPVLKANE